MRVGNSKVIGLHHTLCDTVTTDNIGETITLSCNVRVLGQYVIVQIMNRTQYLHICEVEVIGQGKCLFGFDTNASIIKESVTNHLTQKLDN